MDWGGGRDATLTQLQRQVRESGSFVDRAIVREAKIASERFAETHAAWTEIRELLERWEKKSVSDLKILEAIRWINRIASGWRTGPRKPIDILPPGAISESA